MPPPAAGTAAVNAVRPCCPAPHKREWTFPPKKHYVKISMSEAREAAPAATKPTAAPGASIAPEASPSASAAAKASIVPGAPSAAKAFIAPEDPVAAGAPIAPASLLFVFLDGVGLGKEEQGLNPFCNNTPHLDALLSPRYGHQWKYTTLEGMAGPSPGPSPAPGITLEGIANSGFAAASPLFLPLDPVMGVSGLPQSATGQCSLITGSNCQGLMKTHWGPRPNEKIKDLLRQGSLFTDATEKGGSICFAAAFPRTFFQALETGLRIPSTLQQAFIDAGGTLPGEAEFRSGHAISSDITGKRWHTRLEYRDTPVLSPEEAARHLMALSRKHSVTLYEYWYSDYLGHRGTREEAEEAIRELDLFLATLLGESSSLPGSSPLTVVISSDHGNLEDLGTKGHTSNPVPFIAAAPRAVLEKAVHITTIGQAGAWMRSLTAALPD
jgi:2,3-bisphosphoglycerate-independent phosphoglycerate mutase